jgi:(4S)-4-hydroxy-5-phosphonooxypentane-2,3-dione isomerase
MDGFVIVVDFKIHAGQMQAFRKLIDDNARASVRDEPGCSRFDVCADRKDPDRIVLYEIYDDRAAFDAHLKTPHFAAFNEKSAPLVATKAVSECDLVCEGSAAR